jgi:hypothetical protein
VIDQWATVGRGKGLDRITPGLLGEEYVQLEEGISR